MKTILSLEQGHEKMIIPGSDLHRLPLGKGSRELDLMMAPPAHLALKDDECGAGTEDKRVNVVYNCGRSSTRGWPAT
eukprot:5010480-Pyramimonas_sp.AAC.1